MLDQTRQSTRGTIDVPRPSWPKSFGAEDAASVTDLQSTDGSWVWMTCPTYPANDTGSYSATWPASMRRSISFGGRSSDCTHEGTLDSVPGVHFNMTPGPNFPTCAKASLL